MVRAGLQAGRACPSPGARPSSSQLCYRPESPSVPLTWAPASAAWSGPQSRGGSWLPLGSLPRTAGVSEGGDIPRRLLCAHLLSPRWPRAQMGQGKGRWCDPRTVLSPVMQGLEVPCVRQAEGSARSVSGHWRKITQRAQPSLGGNSRRGTGR